MSRKKAREGLVSLMYQSLFDEEFGLDKVNIFIDNFGFEEDEGKFILSGYTIIKERLEEIDTTISNSLKNWTIERLFRLDLSILRVAVYEILYADNIPNEVAINEAVEIAKKFGTKDSSKLINGILGTIIRSEQ